MNELQKDLTILLRYYVERQSNEEKIFTEDQKICKLKLCLSVSHLNNERTDLLMIHTKLNQLKHDSLRNENVFYIKSQKVSHCTGITLENHDNKKVMSIETIITRDKSKCETVFMTLVTKTDDGKRKKTQRSFTREIMNCQHSDEDSNVHNKYKTIFSDNEDENSEIYKDIKNNVDITTLQKTESQKISSPDQNKKKSNAKSNKKSKQQQNSNKETTNIITTKKTLEPLRRSKSNFKEKVKHFFHKPTNLTTIDQNNIPNFVLNNRKMSLASMRNFSTEKEEMGKRKPTNILAKIYVSEKKQLYEFIEDDDFPFMDEENDYINDLLSDTQKFNSDSESYIHFDFLTDITAQNTTFFENASCTCKERRMVAITNCMNSWIDKKSIISNAEMDNFNSKTCHFNDCSGLPLHSFSSSFLSPTLGAFSGISSSLSSVFLPNSPNNMTNVVTSPEPDKNWSIKNSYASSIEQLDKVLDNMKNIDEIQCSMKHINYFTTSTKYKKYKRGLLGVLDSIPSLESMILFLFMTRVIIRQIDDPCLNSNEDINRIMNFSDTFLTEYYYEEIEKRGGLEVFIFYSDDID